MWAMAMLSLLLLTKRRRRWKRRSVNICTIKRLFLMKLHILLSINFFKDVGKVVRVRFVVLAARKARLCGFVEFASANQAKMALQKKNCELHNLKIFLDVAYRGATYLPPPKYCIDHKVWYEEDYLQRESLVIEEEDATVEGLDKTPDFAEVVLLIANLSSQTTQIMHIIHFFRYVGEVVSVRFIVNHEGKHVGYGFVQFASAYQAKKALEEKNGEYLHDHQIVLMKGLDKTPDCDQTVATVRNKTLFVANLSNQTQISDIINFFRDVGEVVHVRRLVNQRGRVRGYGFVGFASADGANKMRVVYSTDEKYFSNHLKSAGKEEWYRCCIDHKVWYEDYLERESLVIEEDAAAVETPDFAEEVAVRKKMVFVAAKLSNEIIINDITRIFKDIVRARLIVDHEGKPVGCFFVEHASANEAKKAAQEMNSGQFFVKVAEIDRPYPFPPNYTLEERLWYDDNLLRKNFGEKSNGNPVIQFSGKRTTFSDE